jgi:hypothetical protein
MGDQAMSHEWSYRQQSRNEWILVTAWLPVGEAKSDSGSRMPSFFLPAIVTKKN